jgi:proline-specific peptidase
MKVADSASLTIKMRVLPWSDGSTATWIFQETPSTPHDIVDAVPLVVIPGGPGLPHQYLLSLVELMRPDRPIVFYDPMGCGRSVRNTGNTHRWALSMFVDELRIIVEQFAGENGCFLLGHSSGGWIALEAMIEDAGLRDRVSKLVLASVPLDVPAFARTQQHLIRTLGPRARRWLSKAPPADGSRASRLYYQRYEEFLHRHVCTPPWPAELVESVGQSNQELYETLWGPSEVCITGELANWSCTNRVGALDMPILLTSGERDEVAPDLVVQAQKALPTSQWRLFENSAHMPHLEESEQYVAVVDRFLDEP